MKHLNQMLALTGACVLALGTLQLPAQENTAGERPQRRDRPPGEQGGTGATGGDRGNRGDRGPGGGFDPAEMQARMMERVKEGLEIKDDAEWKAIEPIVSKVMEARREQMAFGVGGMMRGMGMGRRGGDAGGGGDRPRGGFFGEPSPEADALQKAIDSKASNAEVKAALAKYRDAKKAKEEVLKKAQDDLRKVLSVRQEAIAVNNGWLN
jgi:hypothetical protein